MNNNIFTVDVEEYYHAENIFYSLPEEEIRSFESRVEIGAHKLLDLLQQNNDKATFFILGCVAERNKDLVREIASLGHELASHGYEHTPLQKHTFDTFEEDLKKSINVLSDIINDKIIGYRAPGFSFSDKIPWFFETLRKYQMVYDSSISFSFFRKCQFQISEKQGCYETNQGILEFPVSFYKIGPIKLPLGGGYFRAYPYWLTKWGLNCASHNTKIPAVFYIHPWELDPHQPRFNVSRLRYFRHCLNLNTAERKLQRLLAEMKFTSVKDFLGEKTR